MSNEDPLIGAPVPPLIQVPPPYYPQQFVDTPQNKNRGGPFSLASVVLAILGIIPLIIFLFSSLSATDWMGRSTMGIMHFAFFLLGIIVHGLGLGLGITGYVMGSKATGLMGIIGNGAIIFMTLLGGLRGLC